MVSRQDFEHLEGVFHDGLGTYFELMVANHLIEDMGLAQSPFDTSNAVDKMQSAMARLTNDPRRTVLQREVDNMRLAAAQAAASLEEALAGQVPTHVHHCAGQYAGGLAADLRLIVPGHEDVPVSLKTDKSGKVALADIGQTSDLYKWFSVLFRLTAEEVDQQCSTATGLTLAEARLDFQNIA